MDTTASQMLDSAHNVLVSLRSRLASSTEDKTAEQLAGICHEMAAAEGQVYLLTTVAAIMGQEDVDLAERKARATSHVYAVLSQGPDDGWSGRGNDLRRSRFDGITRSASDLRFGVLGVN